MKYEDEMTPTMHTEVVPENASIDKSIHGSRSSQTTVINGIRPAGKKTATSSLSLVFSRWKTTRP